MSEKKLISVIIPVSERLDPARELYEEYRAVLIDSPSITFEFIYVLDGVFVDTMSALQSLIDQGEPIAVIQLSKSFGEATALTAAFEAASGDYVMTLPAYRQVDPAILPTLIERVATTDLVVAVRSRENDSAIRRAQGKLFNGIVSRLTGQKFQDLGCSVRIMKRDVTSEINVYGDQHRFIPILAAQLGFSVVEVTAQQSMQDTQRRLDSVGVYVRRLLDVATVFFVTKFTKKPLRFFGLFGSVTVALGSIGLLIIVAQRIFGDIPLADRPALMLVSLLIVLGVQLFAIGLIGELIIFTHARDLKEYQVQKTINFDKD